MGRLAPCGGGGEVVGLPAMRQLPLALGPDPAQDFASYAGTGNEAVVRQLRDEAWDGAPIYLWGPAGAGKSHLLSAAAHRVDAEGRPVVWAGAERRLPWPLPEAGLPGLVVIDDCDRLDAAQQQAAFTLFVQLAGSGTTLLAAGTRPPVDLPLRDDLRSRLGWGLVYKVEPLDDAGVRQVLAREALRRGIVLTDEVGRYLQTRFSRDLGSLMMLLDRLDRFSLAQKRAVTVPLLKQMLAEGDT